MTRTFRFLISLTLALLGCSALAQTCEIPRAQIGGQYYYGEMAICNVTGGRYNPPVSVTRAAISGSQITCYGMSRQGDGTTIEVAQFYANFSIAPCPVCPSGQTFDKTAGQCVASQQCSGVSSYCSTLKGSVAMFERPGQVDMSGGSCLKAPDFQSCSQGCATSAVGMGVQYKNNAGQWMSAQELKVTGGTCAVPPESDQPAQKDTDCAGGYAEMNGVKKCVPSEAAKGDTKEKTTEKADGSKETVKTETKCENGVCETTKTSTKTGADGSTSTETSKTSQDQNTYCSKNPTSTVCAAANGGKNPGSGGSGSGSGSGSGTGSGNGSGNGSGDGDGDGNGSGGGSTTVEVPDIEVKKLYERKYPEGIKSAWKDSGIKAASAKFESLAAAFVPPWQDVKGQCQSFGMSIDVGFVSFGRHDFSPPCSIWLFIWVCMQVGALFLFRALVFGG